MKICRSVPLLGVALCASTLTLSTPMHAQERLLRNSVGVSLTTLRFFPGEQYIGVGVDYRFMFRKST